jgi:signal peptidase I
LFRTFEAEAFVIPTGSMAPTLQGRHKDLQCEKCGHRIRSSASDEEKAMEMAMQGRFGSDGVARAQVVDVTCPICRYRTSVDPQTDGGRQYPSYNGDRIIVAKFPYDFVDPERWDVVVFKFPNDAKTNYIKRLVGLPNESVRIRHGDIFTWPNDVEEEVWQAAGQTVGDGTVGTR